MAKARQPNRNSMASMQTLLDSQTALNQQMEQSIAAMTNAANMLSIAAGSMITENAPGVNPYTGRPTNPYGGGPNGGRPRVGDDQTKRPEHGAGFHGVRQAGARALERRFGASSGSRYVEHRDAEGNLLGHYEFRADGSRTFRDANENPVSEGELAAARSRGALSGVFGKVASGAGATSILRAVPYVGAAVVGAEAVTQGLHFIGRQREANAQYQSIYGGSNFGTGFHNRRLQTGFRLHELFTGGLTGRQADQAFQGVSSLGFSGAQRSQDLNFISSNYKKLGMDVSDSLKLITDASKDFNTQLAGLKQGLKDVTQAAKDTGQNAGAMRQVLIQNNAALGGAFLGPGAGQLAANITTQSTRLGRGLQGIDFTGALTSLSQQAVLGGYTGKTPTQLRSMIAQGGSQMYGLLDYQLGRAVQGSATPEVQNFIQQWVHDHGGPDRLKKNPSMLQPLADALEQQGLINTDTLQAAFGASNVPVNQQQAGLLFAGVLSGVVNFQGLANQNQDKLGRSVSKQVITGSDGNRYTKAMAGLTQGGQKTFYDPTDLSKTITSNNFTKGTVGRGTTVDATVVSDPVVSHALSQLKGVKVAVTTAGGAQIVTDIQTAAKDFRDQIAMGTAQIVSGEHAGQTVSQALGGESETNYYQAGGGNTTSTDATAWLKTHDGKKSKASTLDDYYTSQNKKGGVSGTVTIEPSAALQQLLSFNAAGNVSIAYGGAAQGLTPLPGSK